MKRIPLDRLSHYSSWPARLADPTFAPKVKTPQELYREYNDDKYAPLLSAGTLDEARERYWGGGGEVAFSRHDELFVGSKKEAHALRNKLFVESLRPLLGEVGSVVELGAGFGQMLYLIQQEYPHLKYVAGEFTPNGVRLGQRLLPGIQFMPFDFMSEEWSIFDGVKNALLLTVHSVEMMSDAGLFVRKVKAQTQKIRTVVNFEPIYEDGGTPLSRLRQRYIEVNGYCRNILQSIPDAVVERDFFGLNPLFPENRIEWRP